MGRFGRKIDVLEQVVLHEVLVTLVVAGAQAHIFIKIERGDCGEIETSLSMQADQFTVGPQRSTARGQPQYAGWMMADPLSDAVCGKLTDCFRRIFNDNTHPKRVLKEGVKADDWQKVCCHSSVQWVLPSFQVTHSP